MSALSLLLLWVIFPTNILTYRDKNSIKLDAKLDTLQLMKKYGFPGEKHIVITEDGYILIIHRLARPGAVPVLLMHGLIDTSATWVMLGPNKGLGYLLYNKGYDVWMANPRGNTYGLRHRTLSPKSKKFWDFSFHEIGIFDITSTIDYILKNTTLEQLHYIGFSQGTTAFFVMGSERPEYMNKIRSMHALAPVVSFKNSRSPLINFLGVFSKKATYLTNEYGHGEFPVWNPILKSIGKSLCVKNHLGPNFCQSLIFPLFGLDRAQINITTLPIIMGHIPSSISTKQLVHFGQMKRLGQFRKFDYGPAKNKRIYKSNRSPPYKLDRITTKVGLYYGPDDDLTTPKDARIAATLLPNVIETYEVPYKKFNHLDFIWAMDAAKLVWNRVISNMKKYDDV